MLPTSVLSPNGVNTTSRELHGFCDDSELAYGGVVYLRFKDPEDIVLVALVIAKTKVAQIKNLNMPRLELCGAVIVSRLLDCRQVLEIPINNTLRLDGQYSGIKLGSRQS